MKHITKIILILISAGLLFSVLVYITYLNPNNGFEKNTESNSVSPDEVDWKTAMEILQAGQVTEVVQSHNLDVTLTLEDGSQIKTVEPAIDAVFREIELCGSGCSETVLITE